MNTQTGIFILALFMFVWITAAWGALVQLSRGRVRRIESKNRRLSKKAEEWVENKSRYEVVFRFFLFFAIAILAEFFFSYLRSSPVSWPLYGAAVVAALATLLLVAVTELITRALVFRFDLHILKITMPIIKIFRYSIFSPVGFLVELIQRRIENRPNQQGGGERRTTTEDEILSLVELEKSGGEVPNPLRDGEKRMICGILDLDDTSVREIMTPRVDVVALPASSTINEAIALFTESRYSRIPIYMDSIDEIKGIIYAKDFLKGELVSKMTLEQLAHLPIFIPESKAVGALLEEIKKTRNHFAVIIDEYGGTAGIVTLQDIIEKIMGEIFDEYDTDEDAAVQHVTMPDGSVVFDSRTFISDVNKILGTNIPEDKDIDTIGGFICGKLGRIPRTDEEIVVDNNIHATILKADKRKILKLKLNVGSKNDQR